MKLNNYTEIVYVAPSTIHGRGLFARKPIERGEYIGTYEGPFAKRNGTHVLWIEDEDGQEVGISGRNALRFANHARNPNAEFEGFDLYAQRTIAPGAEITVDYGSDWEDLG